MNWKESPQKQQKSADQLQGLFSSGLRKGVTVVVCTKKKGGLSTGWGCGSKEWRKRIAFLGQSNSDFPVLLQNVMVPERVSVEKKEKQARVRIHISTTRSEPPTNSEKERARETATTHQKGPSSFLSSFLLFFAAAERRRPM